MQKDMHFYMTYAVARRVGVEADKACKLAWADQFTDDLTQAASYGIQTQTKVDLSGNWADGQIQLTVLVPFHFVPGEDHHAPWTTTPNCRIAGDLIDAASTSGNTLRFGIALHALQDTFSHAGFSGWREKANSCYEKSHPLSIVHNIGHAEMGTIPDEVHRVWIDPRSGDEIDNRKRAMACARATFDAIVCHLQPDVDPGQWCDLQSDLQPIFEMSSMGDRKDSLRSLAGVPELRYRDVTRDFSSLYDTDFPRAATDHLSLFLTYLNRLPRRHEDS